MSLTPTNVDHHVDAVRLLVQPPIDAKADRIHLQEFFNRASEDQPRLFDTLAQQPGLFEIKKQVVIPGKGRVEVATFFLTQQGPVLSFPRRLPFMPDEVPWSDKPLTEEIVRCLKTLCSCHPTWKYLQVTKRREVIFGTQSENSSEMIRRRFAPGVPSGTQQVGVRWTDGDDMYDRKVTVSAVERKNVIREDVGGLEYRREELTKEYGVQVVLEVSNRKLKAMEPEELSIILDHADSYYNETLLKVIVDSGARHGKPE